MVRCNNCNKLIKDSKLGLHNIMCNKEHKMTREEAVKKCHTFAFPETLIQTLENLGLLKFEEKEEIIKVFEISYAANKYGTICLEEWPEGLVLWVGGEVVWKSWIAYAVMGEKFPR